MRKRVFQALWAMTLAWVSPLLVSAQTSQSVIAVTIGSPQEPSMDEAKAWIERELPAMGSDYIVTSSRDK